MRTRSMIGWFVWKSTRHKSALYLLLRSEDELGLERRLFPGNLLGQAATHNVHSNQLKQLRHRRSLGPPYFLQEPCCNCCCPLIVFTAFLSGADEKETSVPSGGFHRCQSGLARTESPGITIGVTRVEKDEVYAIPRRLQCSEHSCRLDGDIANAAISIDADGNEIIFSTNLNAMSGIE